MPLVHEMDEAPKGEGQAEGVEHLETGGGRRLASVTGQTLREHFHLPLHTVAQKFGMCTTAFKKMCRRLGIMKWPHRQLRGIDKKIAALKAELNYATTGDRQQYVSGIMCLEDEKSKLARGAMSGAQAGDLSDGEREECRSPSTDSKDEKDDLEDAQTPPPAAKLHAMDVNDESCTAEMPSLTREGQNSVSTVEGIQGSTVICERELRQHFHLPLHTAAQKFGICTTAFKKLCRRFGIAKWPHRQLRGIDKKIAALKAELNYTTGDRDGCCRSLKALREEKMRISRFSGGASASGDKSLDDHASGASSPSESPILSASDRTNRSSGNDSLWHGGRCLTDDIGADGSATCDVARRVKSEVPAAEELECAAALSMLAQLAGMTQERDRAAAVAGLARTHGLVGVTSESSVLGKRVFDQMHGQPMSSRGSSAAPELDTPPLEPQNQLPALLSPLTAPYDVCNNLGRLLPPIVPKMVPTSYVGGVL